MAAKEEPLKGVFINDPNHVSVGVGEIHGHDLDGKKIFGIIIDSHELYIELMFSAPVVERIKRGIVAFDEESKKDQL